MPDPYLTPDLVLTTYRGSEIDLTFTPKVAGAAISNLGFYDNITWNWFSGTRDRPGVDVAGLQYGGDPQQCLNVVDVGGFPSIQMYLSSTRSAAIPAGEYYAELWLTPPGANPKFVGWAIIKHEQTTFGL